MAISLAVDYKNIQGSTIIWVSRPEDKLQRFEKSIFEAKTGRTSW